MYIIIFLRIRLYIILLHNFFELDENRLEIRVYGNNNIETTKSSSKTKR